MKRRDRSRRIFNWRRAVSLLRRRRNSRNASRRRNKPRVNSAKGAEYKSQGQVPTWSGRRPWIITKNRDAALKGRNTISAFQASTPYFNVRNQGRRARFASRLPLAFIFRAVGAAHRILRLLRQGSSGELLQILFSCQRESPRDKPVASF